MKNNSTIKVIASLEKENEKLKEKLSIAQEKISELEQENLNALSLGDAVFDGIIVVNKSGIVESVNHAYVEITEIEEKEIVGTHINAMIEKGYFTKAVSMEVIKTKKQISALSTINKNKKTVLIVGNPILDKKGEIVKVITVMRNMTQLVNLQSKLENIEKEEPNNELIHYMNKNDKDSVLYGEAPSIMKVKKLINYVAPTDATVLIMGQTGVGKEVVSKEIVRLSKRSENPFIKINCAAITESLLESELFGYVKGSFTGSNHQDKKGLFEAANGGTIFLDEISEMPINLQSKLLRVLQEKEVTPVGGTKSIPVDTRIIAACNIDLEEKIKEGKFRQDLYYRLNVFPINIPSLVDRKSDVGSIAISFLDKFNKKYGTVKYFDKSAINALTKYDWPGNVRELENLVERLTILTINRKITEEDVYNIIDIKKYGEKSKRNIEVEVIEPKSYKEEVIDSEISLKEAVENFEREIVRSALIKGGSSYEAAKILKTTQPTVIRKAQKLGINTKTYQ